MEEKAVSYSQLRCAKNWIVRKKMHEKSNSMHPFLPPSKKKEGRRKKIFKNNIPETLGGCIARLCPNFRAIMSVQVARREWKGGKRGKKERKKKGMIWKEKKREDQNRKSGCSLFQITSRHDRPVDSGQPVAGDNAECGGEHKGSWNLIATIEHASGETTQVWLVTTIDPWRDGRGARDSLICEKMFQIFI